MAASRPHRWRAWSTAHLHAAPKDLHRTAIFIGGSDVAAGEALLAVCKTPCCRSSACRCRCCSTQRRQHDRRRRRPGRRPASRLRRQPRRSSSAARGRLASAWRCLLARQGAEVRIASRQLARSEAACRSIAARVPGAKVEAVATGTPEELRAALTGRTLAIAAGAAGIVLLPKAAPRSRTACAWPSI